MPFSGGGVSASARPVLARPDGDSGAAAGMIGKGGMDDRFSEGTLWCPRYEARTTAATSVHSCGAAVSDELYRGQ